MSKYQDYFILAALIAAIVIMLVSCAATPTPQNDPSAKPIVHPNVPQAAEQCAAQLELVWCHAQR